jgi:uncharacterized phage protein (TIGR02220 family)
MAIIRKHHVGNYTVVDNGFIRDTSLSLKAKGIMLTLLSLPDDWVFTETWLVSQCSDGITAVRSALNELEDHGYLIRERVREEDGKLGDSIYDIYEEPESQKPVLENPNLDKPQLLSTNNYINKNCIETLNTNNTNCGDAETEQIERIVRYLNESIGTHYSPKTKETVRCIRARFKEGFTPDDFRKVIDTKVDDWLKRPDMKMYLRPATLFGPKFESYLNQEDIGNDN